MAAGFKGPHVIKKRSMKHRKILHDREISHKERFETSVSWPPVVALASYD